ncbi:MAG: hypothetical protein KatS3mg113_0121 [Planctomycetaceae bacterium]|nr:MAG: hypothetical protein KatS3mg113_0121 [Planctomycetaceae bacterium]
MIPRELPGIALLTSWWWIAGWLLLSGSCVSAQNPPKPAADDPPLPKLEELEIPTPETFLRGKPFDWIVLLTGEVLIVEPVSPRPDTLKKLQQQYDDLLKNRPAGMSVEEHRQRLLELRRLPITLLNSNEEDPEYQLETRHIQQIIHFEDLLLKRVDSLLDEGKLVPAYELLVFLDRRHRNWPGYDTVYQRFLLLDGEHLLQKGQVEMALVQFERLYQLSPNFPQVFERLGAASQLLMEQAWQQADYRRVRHYLARLERRVKEHPVARDWRERLTTAATETLQQARQASQQGNHQQAVFLVDRAARLWPSLTGLKEAHQELSQRYQIVRAGVVTLPFTASNYPAEQPADERARLLCEIGLFEPDRFQDGLVRYRSSVIESWEPRDLGRELYFRLRARRASWESQPVMTAGVLVEQLLQRWRSGAARGDDRWAANVRSVQVASPWEWQLSLQRIPLRLEGWLRFSVPLTPEVLALNPEIPSVALSTPEQQRFYLVERQPHQVVFRRTRAEPLDAKQRHVAEIIEQRYENWDRLLQALNRGEIDFTPTVEWRDLAQLQQDDRFFLLPYALPRTHIILLNPHAPVAKSRALRRALLHALPRDILLHQFVLERSSSEYGRLVTSPFATKCSAYDTRLPQPPYVPSLAASLALIAQREFGDELPVLKMHAPDDPVVARVVPELLKHWKRIGLHVELIPPDQSPAPTWDLLYATVRLTEPYVDIWTILGMTGSLDWQTLQLYPHWLREMLLELESTVDWNQAVRYLQQLQAEFLTEARWLPLWEVDEWMLARKRITGFPSSPGAPLHTYQHIEQWVVSSWYPTEVP